MRVQLQQLTSQVYLNMEVSRDGYQNLLEQKEALAESFKTIEIRFNAGRINSLDQLVPKINFDRANQNVSTNRYDFILQKKILNFYRGNLLKCSCLIGAIPMFYLKRTKTPLN